jgi:protein-tyrosine phosphatase
MPIIAAMRKVGTSITVRVATSAVGAMLDPGTARNRMHRRPNSITRHVRLLAIAFGALAACGRLPLMATPDPTTSDASEKTDTSATVVPPTGGTDGSADEASATTAGDVGAALMCLPGQRILDGLVDNARDLGGVPLASGASVACGKLYRGSMLPNLSESACAAFASLGVRTVIDLRTESERTSQPDAACVTNSARLIQAPLPTPFSVSPENYVADLNTVDSVALAFTALGDPSAYPIYFHCVYGRDRTGVLAGVILLALGATRDNVMAEYELSAAAGSGSYPASMAAVLDEIERQGGVLAYLMSARVSRAQIAALRTVAIKP